MELFQPFQLQAERREESCLEVIAGMNGRAHLATAQAVEPDLPARSVDAFALPIRWLSSGVAILNPSGSILEINAAFAAWLGVPQADVINASLAAILGARFPGWQEYITGLIHQPDTFFKTELPSFVGGIKQWYLLELTRAGEVLIFRLESLLPPRVELEEDAWDENLRSEPARRNMFVRLLRAESQLQHLFDRWPGAIFSQRPDFSLSLASPGIEQLTGATPETWRKQPSLFFQVVHEGDIEQLTQQLRRLGPGDNSYTATYRVRHLRAGKVSYVLEHREAIFSENGLLLGYEGVWLDVTRQAIAEKRLSSAAWKETLSVLTAGLAHDFSNIMAGIHSLSEVYEAQLPKADPCQEGLTLIRKNALQASQLVQRILNLHHGKVGDRQYHNANDLLADAVALIQKILPRRVQISSVLAPDSLALYVDPVEFRQVLINLALNAADAISDGGKLEFRTFQQSTFDRPAHMQGSAPRAPVIGISIRDTGSGIPAHRLDSIFDPFFTTKALNKGSGLGLYNARLFVEKHHGAISVESQEGEGTTFTIWLPEANFTEAERSDGDQAVQQRHALLLVGPSGRALDRTAQYLRENRYYVFVATSDDSASEALRSTENQFAAVMLMVSGDHRERMDLVRQIRREKLPVKIALHVTGCNQDDIDTQFLTRADLIIPPDESPSEMLRRLRRILTPGSL